MSIRIISDSGCDITQSEAALLGVTILPLKTIFNNVEYRDGIDITPDKFYDMLDNCETLPHTSQITPDEFEKAYQEAFETADEVLVITISAKLSGTYQSALLASAEFNKPIYLFDSSNVAAAQRILIEYAVKLSKTGCTASELVTELEKAKRRLRIIARVDTLEYLKRGGRLSKTAAFAGSVLNIKPVLGVENGEVVIFGKARGSKASSNLLTELIIKRGGIDFSMPYMLLYSGNDDALLKGYIDNSRSLWVDHTNSLPVCMLGSTIGTHVGPGAIGVAFFSNNE